MDLRLQHTCQLTSNYFRLAVPFEPCFLQIGSLAGRDQA
jgi:hypothetical protein